MLFGIGLTKALRFPCEKHRREGLGEEEDAEESARARENHHDPENPAPAEGASRDTARVNNGGVKSTATGDE